MIMTATHSSIDTGGVRMKRTTRFLLVAAMTVAAAGGCDNDFLGLQPTAQYSDALVWSDLALVEAYLNPLYDDVRGLGNDGIGTGGGGPVVSYWDFSGYADESYQKHNYGGVVGLYNAAWNSENFGSNPWFQRYDMIQQLNIFLERIDEVPGDADLRARLKGEARFLRAFYYAELARHLGAVPLITESWTLGDDYLAGVSRTPFDEVVAWVVDELDQAVTALPSQSDQPATERGRATVGAALATKADILMYAASPLHNPGNDQARWQAASDAAKAVIDLGDYSLWDGGDYGEIFVESGWNSEIIFGRLYAPQYNATNWEVFLATNGFQGWSAYTPTQQMVDAYRMANGLEITDPGSGYDPQDPYADREPRLYETILYDEAAFREREMEFWVDESGGGGRDTNFGIQPWNAPETGYAWRKFFDERRTQLDWSATGFSERVWPTFRLSEMYLNYAEAQYQLGNEGVARQYLNAIRTRPQAGLPPSTAAGQALMDDIRRERRIELAFESKRYWDLLRWRLAEEHLTGPVERMRIVRHPDGSRTYEVRVVGDQGGGTPVIRQWNEAYYLWPIPLSELQRTDLQQNPGY